MFCVHKSRLKQVGCALRNMFNMPPPQDEGPEGLTTSKPFSIPKPVTASNFHNLLSCIYGS